MGTIGDRINQLMTARGMSQTELAGLVGIKQPSLSAIISGKTKSLAGDTLLGLCTVLHTTPDFIMNGAGEDATSQELVLIESEVLYLLRQATPLQREAALNSVRGICRPSGPSPADPFASGRPRALQGQKMRAKGEL